MSDPFLKSFPSDIERQKRVGRFFDEFLIPTITQGGSTFFDLEIGCGHGHWLTNYAMANADVMSVGIDLITKRVSKATLKKEKRNLSNLFFYKAEAVEFVSLIPDSIKIQNTFVMFPDPWPKHKHHKRRLIQHDFLTLLHSKTKSSGKIYFRTDHKPYFDWTVEIFEQSPLWSSCSSTMPLEHSSYFQELLPDFQTFCGQALN